MSGKNERPTCSEKDLVLYRYGETSREHANEISRHLDSCPGCRKTLESLRRLDSAVPRDDLDWGEFERARFTAGVMKKIASRRRLRIAPVSGAVAATAAAAILVFGLLAGSPDPPSLRQETGLTAENEILPDPEMLENLELLEHLDVLQDIEGIGNRPT